MNGSALVTILVCTLLVLSLVLFARGLENTRHPHQVTVVVVQTEGLPPSSTDTATEPAP